MASWSETWLCAGSQAARSGWEEATVCPSGSHPAAGAQGTCTAARVLQHPPPRWQMQSLGAVHHPAVRRKQAGGIASCCFHRRLP